MTKLCLRESGCTALKHPISTNKNHQHQNLITLYRHIHFELFAKIALQYQQLRSIQRMRQAAKFQNSQQQKSAVNFNLHLQNLCQQQSIYNELPVVIHQ